MGMGGRSPTGKDQLPTLCEHQCSTLCSALKSRLKGLLGPVSRLIKRKRKVKGGGWRTVEEGARRLSSCVCVCARACVYVCARGERERERGKGRERAETAHWRRPTPIRGFTFTSLFICEWERDILNDFNNVCLKSHSSQGRNLALMVH